MIKKYILILLCMCLSNHLIFADYVPDILGDGFLQKTIKMPNDYDGEVVTTLVRQTSGLGASKAVLYVHGFNDYFFQKEMADFFCKMRYNFYAIDLRKYGRSKLPHQTMGKVLNLTEYFADIDSALLHIKKEGNNSVLLVGHSMGGLVTSLYLDNYDKKAEASFIKGLILNSPFLDMYKSWFYEKMAIPTVAFLGKFFPSKKVKDGDGDFYLKSISKKYKGEWDFNLKWKKGVDITFGFLNAIKIGHRKVHKGLSITQPVLVLHSSSSYRGKVWSEVCLRSDAVLDVNDIHRFAPRLGKEVDIRIVQDGLHDLSLSQKPVREAYYKQIALWLRKK